MQYENQKMLESMFNKHQAIPLIKDFYTRRLETVGYVFPEQVNAEFALHAMSHLALMNKMPVQAMVGIMSGQFKGTHQTLANECLQLAEHDLMDYDPGTGIFQCRFPLPDKVWDLIRQYRYMPPMIVPPLKVLNNRDSGYITFERNRSLLLKNNHHEGELCLDHINRMNQVGLTLDDRIVKLIRNRWKYLDKKKDDETYQDWQDRIDAFKKYEADSFWVIALLMEMGNEIWLTHKYDKRGRTYCQGYHITYQGNAWNKSMIQFQKKELVE